jgi:hypothetical protein
LSNSLLYPSFDIGGKRGSTNMIAAREVTLFQTSSSRPKRRRREVERPAVLPAMPYARMKELQQIKPVILSEAKNPQSSDQPQHHA